MEAENQNVSSVAHTEPTIDNTDTKADESESFMVAEQSGPAANQSTHQNPGETTEAGTGNALSGYSPFQTPTSSGTNTSSGSSDDQTNQLFHLLLNALTAQTQAIDPEVIYVNYGNV